ncbi:hypothetical protein [Rathayibacter iranicus]|nr:hypothetical protein [Rathayibacter iranicus]
MYAESPRPPYELTVFEDKQLPLEGRGLLEVPKKTELATSEMPGMIDK